MVSSNPPNIFDPDVSIAIMSLLYDDVEDLALKLWELSEEGCTCGQILPIAMQSQRFREKVWLYCEKN